MFKVTRVCRCVSGSETVHSAAVGEGFFRAELHERRHGLAPRRALIFEQLRGETSAAPCQHQPQLHVRLVFVFVAQLHHVFKLFRLQQVLHPWQVVRLEK